MSTRSAYPKDPKQFTQKDWADLDKLVEFYHTLRTWNKHKFYNYNRGVKRDYLKWFPGSRWAWFAQNLYRLCYSFDKAHGRIEEYEYETAPYCGHHHSGHNGYFTSSHYHEGDGGMVANIPVWKWFTLVSSYNNVDRIWQLFWKRNFKLWKVEKLFLAKVRGGKTKVLINDSKNIVGIIRLPFGRSLGYILAKF